MCPLVITISWGFAIFTRLEKDKLGNLSNPFHLENTLQNFKNYMFQYKY